MGHGDNVRIHGHHSMDPVDSIVVDIHVHNAAHDLMEEDDAIFHSMEEDSFYLKYVEDYMVHKLDDDNRVYHKDIAYREYYDYY